MSTIYCYFTVGFFFMLSGVAVAQDKPAMYLVTAVAGIVGILAAIEARR